MSRGDRRAVIVLWASIVAFVAITISGASGGLRGSDQYWYFDDTETLLRGDPPITNCLYPRQLLVQGVESSPILHDILPQRAVIPIARLLGPYWSWIAMSIVAMVLGAWMTFIATRRACDPLLASWASSALLLLPLSVQCSTQVLAEPSLVPIFAAMLVLLGRPGGFGKYAALGVVLTLAYMSRFTSVVFLPLLPLAALAERAPWSRRLALAGWSLALVATGAVLNHLLFRGIPTPGNPIALNINGNGMGIWLTTEPIVVTVDSILAKLTAFVKGHADLPPAGMVIAAINAALMLTATLGAISLWRRSQRVMAAFVWIVVAVDVATLTLYQNQIRFILPTYPVLILATAALLERWIGERPRLRAATALATLAVLLPPAALVAWTARRDALREAQACDRLRSIGEGLRGDGDIIHVGGNDQMLAHCLRPRTVLFLFPNQAAADWARIRAMPRWRWIACAPEDLPRLASLGIGFRVVAEAEHRGLPLVVVEIVDRGAAAPGATLSAPPPGSK